MMSLSVPRRSDIPNPHRRCLDCAGVIPPEQAISILVRTYYHVFVLRDPDKGLVRHAPVADDSITLRQRGRQTPKKKVTGFVLPRGFRTLFTRVKAGICRL
jgi:hypothetical protein